MLAGGDGESVKVFAQASGKGSDSAPHVACRVGVAVRRWCQGAE